MNIARIINTFLVYLTFYFFKDKKAKDAKLLYKNCNNAIDCPDHMYN